MAAIQLSFTLRTSPNCKTVHLIGNWDGYKAQLPLSKDASKAGAWKGTFRFQGSTLKQGQRYWYYYVMDGYHVSHDPARPFTTEPTTGRKLNILDVPESTTTSSKPSLSVSTKSARRSSQAIAQGRGISPSRIVSPKPTKPGSAVDNITASLSAASLSSRDESDDSEDDSEDSDSESDSDAGSDVPSLTSSRSSACSSVNSRASSAASNCSCQRFGITRKGERVKLDCGGSRCGGDSDSCSDSEPEEVVRSANSTRRQGVVIRNSRR